MGCWRRAAPAAADLPALKALLFTTVQLLLLAVFCVFFPALPGLLLTHFPAARLRPLRFCVSVQFLQPPTPHASIHASFYPLYPRQPIVVKRPVLL